VSQPDAQQRLQRSGGVPPAFGVLPTKEAVAELDVGEEVMETVLSYLQVRVHLRVLLTPEGHAL
jgi:hypothetical protein